MAANEPVIPIGADAAHLVFENDSWIQAYRDTTGASRWAFRMFNETQPEPLGQGNMTHEGLETFSAQAKAILADGEWVKGERTNVAKEIKEQLEHA